MLLINELMSALSSIRIFEMGENVGIAGKHALSKEFFMVLNFVYGCSSLKNQKSVIKQIY